MRARLNLLVLMCCCSSAVGEVEFDWTTVGDPGNEPERDRAGTSLGGSVDYEYRISKHEVTTEQYAEFLTSVASEDPHELFDERMRITRTGSSGSFRYSALAGFERHPVTFVSFFDVMRFVNWLENGQGTGGTESGTYTIGTGVGESRALDATFFLPSYDEWKKAAYYDPTLADGAGGYWNYATQSDATPTFGPPPGDATTVNTADSDLDGTTEVGAYRHATSFYGTFDQTGNVWEWTEAVGEVHPFRGAFGGAWGSSWFFKSVFRRPTAFGYYTGFRVASRAPLPGADFRRGDCNEDSRVNISDAVFTLRSLFVGQEDAPCDDACDSNDDGTVDISDALNTLGVLFLGNGVVPLPGMTQCGFDPTEDGVDCDTFERCQ